MIDRSSFPHEALAEIDRFKLHADDHCRCNDADLLDDACAGFLEGLLYERARIVEFLVTDWPNSGNATLDARLAARDCEMAQKIERREHTR